MVEYYRDLSYQLSIEKDLLLDKVDTYEQLVAFMRRKYRKLEEQFNHLKSVHHSCSSRNVILYR
jgi:hypothetical protein